MKDLPEKRVPEQQDHDAAMIEWDAEHGFGTYATLTTRKKNALAKSQMFHREFSDLSAAIMGFRK